MLFGANPQCALFTSLLPQLQSEIAELREKLETEKIGAVERERERLDKRYNNQAEAEERTFHDQVVCSVWSRELVHLSLCLRLSKPCCSA